MLAVGHDSFRARGLKHREWLQTDLRWQVGHDSFRARGLKLELARRMPTSLGVGHDSFRARGLKLEHGLNRLESDSGRARFISCSRIETQCLARFQVDLVSGTIHFVLED